MNIDNLTSEQHREIADLLEQIEAIKSGGKATKRKRRGAKKGPMDEITKNKIRMKAKARWASVRSEKQSKEAKAKNKTVATTA